MPGDGLSGETGNSRPRSQSLEAARVPATANGAGLSNRHMAQFRSQPLPAEQKLAIDDHATADARTDRNADKMTISTTCSKPHLSHRRRIGMIVDFNSEPQSVAQTGTERNITPAAERGRV